MAKSERFDVVGEKIVEFINDPLQIAERLLAPWRGTRFVICGASGSGKTQALEFANGLLPTGEQIAESREVVRAKDASSAIKVIRDVGLAYERSLHIAFDVYHEDLGKALESKGIKVFWLDPGVSRKR